MKKALPVLIILLFYCSWSYGQEKNKINPNGYNVFYYPDGTKASEGYMRDGKPDGYWINYYPNGKKKSEGNRKNYLLDSVWIFYNPLGDTTKKITYYLGKKNGWYINYYTHLDSNFVKNIPKSKFLYVDGKRQGKAYFYYPDGKLWKVIPFTDDYANGQAFEYAPDGRIITVITYRYGTPIETQAINRYDQNGKKTGIWRQYYPNGKIKWEATYANGKLNGYYKEYNKYGTLVKFQLYKNGKLITQTAKNAKTKSVRGNLRLVEEYYSQGQLRHSGTYSDSVPVGIHKYYNQNGKLDSAVWYNNLGIKIGKGLVDTTGKKIGLWTLYYDTGQIMAKGHYKNNKKDGQWTYFYKNGKILEKGSYKNGLPDGTWLWYYPDGKLLRKEHFAGGYRDGPYFELSPQGDTILKTYYIEGEPDGNWYLYVGDFLQIGKYEQGRRVGVWKTYYMPEKKIMCIDHYQDGHRDGKHKCYYPNGRIKEVGQYLNGHKNGKWYFYNDKGYLIYTITYQLDEPVKIDDKLLENEH